MWITMAVLSAFFAGITSIFVKSGVKKTDSDVATALRTGVVLLFSLAMVPVSGAAYDFAGIGAKSYLFLVLSGLATGASWLCGYRALKIGDVNKVMPIDKSSVILTVLFAIFFFGETEHLTLRLGCTALITIGVFLMIERKNTQTEAPQNGSWLLFAILSAVFAAATSILAKIGIENVNSNLATAIRTAVVLLLSWAIVFARKKQGEVRTVEKRELLFLVLSGVTTGASWLCYYYAIANGEVSVVVPIDKMSILVTILFSALIFKEKLSKKALFGLILLSAGTLAMAIFAR